jgi:hypothetical protein
MVRTLRVYVNPYVHLDHEGRPCGACPVDPAHIADRREWVGAWLDVERTRITSEPAKGEVRAHTQQTVFAFSQDVQELPLTHGYLDRVRTGELLAADPSTAQAAGVRFIEPAHALEAARKAAVARWHALYGDEPHALADFSFVLVGVSPEA